MMRPNFPAAAHRRPLALLCLGLLAISFASGVAAAGLPGDPLTEIFRLNQFKGPDYVFDLDGAPPSKDVGGGTVRALRVNQLPVLQGLGVSYTLLELAPCGINPMHVHPRATELLYVIEGERIQTGIVLENGAAIKDIILNDISKGEVAAFPVGQTHYQQNLGCESAKLLAALSSEDPGVLPVAPALFKLPADPLATILGLDGYSTEDIRKGLPADPILKGSAECLKRCAGYAKAPAYTPAAKGYTPAPTYAPTPAYTPAPKKYTPAPTKY